MLLIAIVIINIDSTPSHNTNSMHIVSSINSFDRYVRTRLLVSVDYSYRMPYAIGDIYADLVPVFIPFTLLL